ncbi:hypothetical protein V7S43_013085 [Phytophthora oleae]|uniref:Uncharacterized protein n=1 Tax=Phytophthora oleae TaxID=2107226 RepID=A0ABD3F709_9STRA
MDVNRRSNELANALERPKPTQPKTTLPGENAQRSGERPTREVNQQTDKAEGSADRLAPEPMEQPWSEVAVLTLQPEKTTDRVALVTTPQGSKRASQLECSTKHNKNLLSSNANCDEWRTKQMKNHGSTYSQRVEDAGSTASCPRSSDLNGSSHTEPWWNVEDEDTGRVQGVTSWSSK